MSDTSHDELVRKDPFLELKEVIERDIAATGFCPAKGPPGGEPRINGSLENKTKQEIKSLYDEFLAYYEYITDDIVRLIGYSTVTKSRLDYATAVATKHAHANAELTNSDLRKAGVIIDPTTVEATKDHLYFKTMLSMQEERRRKFSKCMDRLGRELWFRTQEDSKSSDFLEKNDQENESFTRVYRKLD